MSQQKWIISAYPSILDMQYLSTMEDFAATLNLLALLTYSKVI